MLKSSPWREVEEYGPVQALHHGNPVLGCFPPYMSVRCYTVDGLMVDSGLSSNQKPVLEWARIRKVREAVLTHHHEDHSGSASLLKDSGLTVRASQKTQAWVSRGFDIRFYQKVVWNPAPPTPLDSLGNTLETAHHTFQVIPAPGHCDDQVVLFEPNEGWLFSGDAFLASRVKYFRADEDFAATLDSLQRLCQLDFDSLFCAHRPVPTGGREALRQKLQHFQDLEGRVKELHARGYSLNRITRETLGPESWLLMLLSLGDLCKRNLVRSILYGPRPRADAPKANPT